MANTKPRLFFIHSETRSYRVPIFDLIAKHYDTVFFFMEGKKRSAQFPETKNWNYKDLEQYSMIGYSSDFSPGVIRELIIRRKTYDIIISSGLATFATHISFILSKLLRKKFIIWSEDWTWSTALLPRLALFYARAMIRGADACLAASSKTKELFLQFGAAPKKTFIAPNCALDLSKITIDANQLERIKKQINPEGKIIISYLGRVVKYKALDTLIKAFAQLEKNRANVLLLIVGDGPFAPECQKIIKQKNIKNFYWPQYDTTAAKSEQEIIPQKEMFFYLNLANIFVLPGRFTPKEHVTCESWGLTLNEALSLGKPLISTNSVAAAYDLIKNGENGYRVKENDVHALLTALDKIAGDEFILRAMGKKSREIFEKYFQYHHMFEGFKQTIKFVWPNEPNN